MFSKLKEIKDLRSQAKTLQNALNEEHVEASAAWGKIKIKMDGNQEVEAVEIDRELLSADKKSDLEKGIKDAVNEANHKVQKIMAEKVRKQGGLNIPGLAK
jgi:nucleoid-associated protein EbfC